MKKEILLGCVLYFGAMNAMADSIDVNRFRYAGPYPIRMPYVLQPTDAAGKHYTEKDLLKSRLSMDVLKHSNASCDGSLPASDDYTLHLVGFNVDNARYATAKLHVDGVEHYTTYIDGKEHTGEEDVDFEPGTHHIVIKCLTAPQKPESIRASLQSKQDGVFQLNEGTKHLYTLRDVMEGTRFSQLSLSSKGSYLITSYVNTDSNGHKQYYHRVTDTASGRVLAEKNTKLYWMPRSEVCYFVRQTGGTNDLITLNPSDGKETVLATGIPDGDFRVAPTEDYLLYTLQDEGPKEDKPLKQIIEPDDRQAGWRNRSYLARYDLKTGLLQRLTFGYRNVQLNDLSKDGTRMLFSSSKQRITSRPFNLSSVYLMDLSTMKVDTLMTDEGYISQCFLSPDQKQILFVASPEAFKGIGMDVRKGQIPSLFDNQLYLYDLRTQDIKPLTKNFYPSVSQVEWSADSRKVYFTANNRDYVSLYEMQLPTGDIRQLDTHEDVVTQFAIATHAPRMVYYGESASNASRSYLMDLGSSKAKVLEDLNAIILKDVELGTCTAWNFKNNRGDTIYGRFYLPPHFDPKKKYPLIVNYYGGCMPIERTLESRYPLHAYAALGYVVYVVEPSGAIGFGQEFAARHVNGWGDYTADDIIEGTRQFCKEHPFIDPKKIGCIGASYGGFMTQYLQTKTDLFAAAISHAGISNITSYWGEGYWGYSYSEAASADSYPWNNPKLYTDHSPLFHADKIHTPLLFLHGTEDTNVPIGESIQMFTALKLLGRETAFVTVEGQNHQIFDFDKRIQWQNTIFAWFAKWLQNDPTWWNKLYPEKEL